MNLNNEYLKTFKEFEESTINKYIEYFGATFSHIKISEAVSQLCNRGIYPYNKQSEFFRTCADIRNILSHSQYINDSILVNKGLIDNLKKYINEINNPYRAIDIAIKKENIYSKGIRDNIQDTIKIMTDKTYTHIPILENNKIIGVFCEKTLFNYINNEELASLDLIKTFNDIKKYLDIDNYKSTIKVIKRDLKLDEIINIFKKSFYNQENLECLFITTNGTINGDILGMITIWDILNKYT